MTPRAPPKPFTALVLDAGSRALLLALVKPLHGKVFADHVTLEHDPAVPLVGEFPAVARVVEVRSDARGQAVGVELDLNAAALLAKGARAHVTVSCRPDTLPEHSRSLEGSTALPFALVLRGTVKTVAPK